MSNTPVKMNQSPTPAIRAYLGGSFNPVHNGHIQVAMAVYNCLLPIAAKQQCTLHVSLLPNARSPFKKHSLAPKHRLAMVQLAIDNTPLQIDELELWQAPPVYSIDSVRTLRQRYPDDSLIFIMGMDSARSLDKWKQGLQLTDYVHLWIFDRDEYAKQAQNQTQGLSIMQAVPIAKQPSGKEIATHIATLVHELPYELQPQVTRLFTELATIPSSSATEPLKSKHHGRIYLDIRSVATISSTEIRKQFYRQDDKRLPSAIIADNSFNQLSEWLNPKVYHYIIAHQLYSAD